jgi:hypothetical protein
VALVIISGDNNGLPTFVRTESVLFYAYRLLVRLKERFFFGSLLANVLDFIYFD